MGETLADYALLLTQARSRCCITATSDSLIQEKNLQNIRK